jgi:hypothetical protein
MGVIKSSRPIIVPRTGGESLGGITMVARVEPRVKSATLEITRGTPPSSNGDDGKTSKDGDKSTDQDV